MGELKSSNSSVFSELGVTVVMPVYNGDRYLRAAIESVLAQEDCRFELIIVDDGSTDQTAKILQDYHSRIRYFYQENQGVSVARNLGIEQAKGRYVAFLDADDYFLPHKLSRQLEVFRSNPSLGLVHSGWQRIDASGNVILEVCPWKTCPTLELVTWLQHKPVLPSAMMFERQWLQRVGGFDPQLKAAEDVDLVLRLAIEHCQSQWLPQVTTAYRQHGQSAMGNGRLQASSLKRILDKIFSHPELPPEARLIEQKVRYSTLLWAAWYLYQTDSLQDMVEQLKQVYDLSPKLPTVALTEWLESFEAFSKNVGETLDIELLMASGFWQGLRCELMN